MTSMQPLKRYEIGRVGLGVMGRNLLMNMADHGFSVAGYDKDRSKVEALRKESADRDICGAENINDFIGLLRPPCLAYRSEPGLPNLLLDPEIWRKIITSEEKLRRVVCTAAELGVPAPGLMAALGYLDGYRSPWLPANLIQAQRDYFGAHTHERIDAKGTFRTEWDKN
jgi:6-phosphogluconate dehydrogenase